MGCSMVYCRIMVIQTLRQEISQVTNKIIKIIGSRQFFYAVIALAVLQALWFAVSFKPWFNDEGRHFETIEVYTQQLSPFLGSQKASWDHLGALARDGSYMFYYVMSWPLRLIQMFTIDQAYQIIFLRMVSIVFFARALVLLRRAFLLTKRFPSSLVNITMLFFVLVPSVGLLAGTINYDNLVFLLFSWVLLLSVKVMSSKKLELDVVSWLLIAGMAMSIIKWTSIALLLPVVLFLAYDLYKKYRVKPIRTLKKAFGRLPRGKLYLVSAVLVLSVGLFVERPVTNLLLYGSPAPACPKVLNKERCMKFQDFAYYSNVSDQKPGDFRPVDPVQYSLVYWFPAMTRTASNLLERPNTNLPIIRALFNFIGLFAAIVLLVSLMWLRRDRYNRFFLAVALAYMVILMAQEYSVYNQFGIPAAIRLRYLVPVLPLFILLTTVSLKHIFGKYRTLLLLGFICLLLSMTQGGGGVTYLLTTPESVYWPKKTTIDVNRWLKSTIDPLVKE